MNTSSDARNPIERLAEEFLDRKRRGEQPTLREYVERYPHLAADIRDLFPALLMMEDLGEDSGSTTGSLAVANGAAVGTRLHRLGDYRILREIGRGGMGVVYEAEQESLGRRVALKVLSAGSRLDPKQVRRFEREAKAAARLHHTNIVPVFGVGRQDGVPYFVMQFIAGLGLDMVLEDLRRLREAKSEASPTEPWPASLPQSPAGPAAAALFLSTRRITTDRTLFADGIETETEPGNDAASDAAPIVPETGSHAGSSSCSANLPGSSELSASSDPDRQFYLSVARIGVQVAEALEYANRQGILHRDVKPSNLLLDNRGNVWVADFGLAKLAEADDLTRTGDILGTIRYMAPERFSGHCDAQSDVYSLGLTLYELVTLRPAYEGSDRHTLINRVLHEEPERMRKRAPGLPRDLETIIAKAMAREPVERYATAGALAEDLQRFVEDRPIRARRVSAAERLLRWCRRNRLLAASLGMAAAAMVVVTLLAVLYAGQQAHLAAAQKLFAGEQTRRADAQKLYADEQARRADEQAEATREITHMAAELEGRSKALRTLLDESSRRLAMLNFERGRAAFEKGQIGPGMLWMAETFRNATEARDPAWMHVASTNLAAWRPLLSNLRTVFSHGGPVRQVAFGPDGKTILTRSDDGMVRLWDAVSARPIGRPLQHQDEIKFATFSPDGNTVLTGGHWTAQLWDARTGLPIGPPMLHPRGEITAVAFSPDGNTVLTGCLGQTTRRWDARTGLPIGPPLEHEHYYAERFSPDGKTAIMRMFTKRNRTTQLWDLTTNQPIGQPEQNQIITLYAAFSPDSKTFRSMVIDELSPEGKSIQWNRRQTRLWDVSTGRPLGEPIRIEGLHRVLAASPDGTTILGGSNGTDTMAQLWNAATGEPLGRPWVHQDRVLAGTFSPDGRTVLTGVADGTARLWDVGSGRPIGEPMQHRDAVSTVAFSPDGKTILTGSADKTARLWDAEIGQAVGKPLDIESSHAMFLTGVAFSPDGKTILTGSGDKTARMWDAATGQAVGKPLRHPMAVLAVAFSPDGKTIVTAGRDNYGRLWDAGTGRVVGKPMPLGMPASALAFSPDGKTVLAADKIWDATSGQYLRAAYLLRDATTGRVIPERYDNWHLCDAIAFRPDGKVILNGCRTRTARLWDAATGRPIGEPLRHHGSVLAVAFSPDGRTIGTGSGDKTAYLWDAASGRPIGSPLEHRGEVRSVAFSPDGKTVLTGCSDGTARLWDAATGQPIGRPMEHRGEVIAAVFSPDGKTILTTSPPSATTLEDFGAALWLWPTPTPLQADDPRRIAAWVETATGLELDRQGSVRLLDNDGWRQRRDQLDRLGGPPSAGLATMLDPLVFGPDPTARADGLMRLNRFAEAEAAYAESVRARPFHKSVWSARAHFHMSRARPERAADDFAEAIQRWPNDFFLRERLCLVLRAAGDRDGLKRAVSGLLEGFGTPSDFDEASRVASTCVMAPDVVDPEIPIRLAEFAFKEASEQNKAFPRAIYGAALYRAGRFRDAIRSLEASQKFQEAWPFLAMAHARLGHRDESRRWLDRLRNERAKPVAASARPPGVAPEDNLMRVEESLWNYFRGLKIRLLCSEAEAVVLYDPVFPADSFAH